MMVTATAKITLKMINDFLRESQPNLKMKMADALKNKDKELYSSIMQADLVRINNKLYYFDKQKQKYILY